MATVTIHSKFDNKHSDTEGYDMQKRFVMFCLYLLKPVKISTRRIFYRKATHNYCIHLQYNQYNFLENLFNILGDYCLSVFC